MELFCLLEIWLCLFQVRIEIILFEIVWLPMVLDRTRCDFFMLWNAANYHLVWSEYLITDCFLCGWCWIFDCVSQFLQNLLCVFGKCGDVLVDVFNLFLLLFFHAQPIHIGNIFSCAHKSLPHMKNISTYSSQYKYSSMPYARAFYYSMLTINSQSQPVASSFYYQYQC